MDISKLCRSCMREVASWEIETFAPRTVEMFCFCTNIKITEDTLPRQFCYECKVKIESAYTFITEALKVNVTLKNITSRTNTLIIVKPDVTNNNDKNIESRLTLPDYKISSTIDNYNQLNVFETIDNTLQESAEYVDANIQDNDVNDIEKDKNICQKEMKTNTCPVCLKGFMSMTWLKKHREKEHSGHKYNCGQCSKSFAKPSQLSYHSTTHSDERKFVCTVCGKRFKRRKQLAIHTRAHSDLRPYTCDQCNMRFKLKSVLKCHMKVHKDEKQYLCSICGWSFAQGGNLEVHMRTHTGEKPFSCNLCEFRSAAASSARRHARRHNATPSHVCKHCRKGFYDASGLVRHSRTHTGELPYKCPGCERSFSDSWKRKTHLMRAHHYSLQDIPAMRTDRRTTYT